MELNKKLRGEIRGESRKRTHLLAKHEDRLINFLAPKVPSWLQTYHLTLSAIPFALLVLLFGHWSYDNKLWLIGIAVVVELRYLSDILDGEVGRRRNTGLVKWGYYTDHILDLLFAGALFAAYSLSFPQVHFANFAIFIVIALFFQDTNMFALVGKNYITSGFLGKISPTEMTQLLILLTVVVIFLPEKTVEMLFIIISVTFFMSVSYHIYLHSKQLWIEDMEKKHSELQQ